jgi:hypothetical protein
MTDLIKDNNDDANITVELDILLDEVRLCIEKCRQFNKIPRIGKLERKFRAEDRFLQRVGIFFIEEKKTIQFYSLSF